MSIHPYVAIEGAIGVGKTTLARILGEAFSAQVLLEVFEENPFLSSFYTDRSRYAFQTQVFFLLSRYRQQHKVIAEALSRSALISDYLFDKDWLFAHLNLGGDELAMYRRVYAILGEQIPTPSLVVYLRANTDTLMQRIVLRDRPYERQMSEQYIADLRLAYERFFADFTAAPVLTVETDQLDIVRDPDARAFVVGQVRQILAEGAYQPLLPAMEDVGLAATGGQMGRRLTDLQRFDLASQRERGLAANVFFHYTRLAASVGLLGATVAEAWEQTDRLLPAIGNEQEARDRAVQGHGAALESALSETLSCLLKIANDAGIDLENAYLKQRVAE